MYFSLGGQESLGLYGATIARLLLAAAVMGVPTFLMGGTLPAAVRSITTAGDARRRGLAVLYGVNTLGAVCGAYFATFFALEFLGTRATLWFGCALNLLVGVIAISLSRRMRRCCARCSEDWRPAVDERGHGQATRASSLLYATAAVLGFTFFTLELVWYRMLAPILGGTTFTFGLILCIALLGIGDRRRVLSLRVSLGAAELVGVGDHLCGGGGAGGVAVGTGRSTGAVGRALVHAFDDVLPGARRAGAS